MRSHLLISSLAVAFFVIGLAGCNSRRPGAPVTGKVTMDGKPLPGGSVLVESSDGRLNDSGPIDANGVFVVPNAPLGKVKVCILVPPALKSPAPLKKPNVPGVQEPAKKSLYADDVVDLFAKVPERFRDVSTSGFEFTIAPGKNPPCDLDIKTEQ